MDGHATSSPTEMRDPSAAAQGDLVQRLFGRLERKFEAQWQAATKDIHDTAKELDSAHREHMQKLEQRQYELEQRVEARMAVVENTRTGWRIVTRSFSLRSMTRRRGSPSVPPSGTRRRTSTSSKRTRSPLLRGRGARGHRLCVRGRCDAGRLRRHAGRPRIGEAVGCRVRGIADHVGKASAAGAHRAEDGGRHMEACRHHDSRRRRRSPLSLQASGARFPAAAGRARVLRKEGPVAIDWHRVAKVEIRARDDEPTISWNIAALAALGIEGAEARSAVASSDPSRRAQCSVVFDAARVLSACTCNGRAVLHQDPRIRARKMHEVRALMKRNDIVALQETHMTKEATDIEIAAHSKEWRVCLRLKTHKCVPLWAPTSPAPGFEMRRWLLEALLDWSCFRVVSAATHVGFVMGPEGGTRSLAALLEKWAARAAGIGRSGAPAGGAGHICATTAVTVLGYFAQVMAPPPQLEELERRAVSKAMCLPGNTLGRRGHLDVADAGGARMGSVLAYVTARRVRAAICTVPDWSRDPDVLREAARERGMLADLARGDNVLGWWDAPPLAVNLRNAARAACDVPRVHDALRNDFEDVLTSSSASATRVMTRALAPGAVAQAVGRRLWSI